MTTGAKLHNNFNLNSNLKVNCINTMQHTHITPLFLYHFKHHAYVLLRTVAAQRFALLNLLYDIEPLNDFAKHCVLRIEEGSSTQ